MSRKGYTLTLVVVLGLSLAGCPQQARTPGKQDQNPGASNPPSTGDGSGTLKTDKPGTGDVPATPPPPPAARKPAQLKITKVEVDPPAGTTAETFRMTIHLANAGEEEAAPVSVKVLAGGKTLAEKRSLPRIQGGQTRVEVLFFQLDEPGTHAVGAVVDPGTNGGTAAAPEVRSDPAALEVKVSRKADLAVALDGPRESPAPGAEFLLTVRVRNAGNAEARDVKVHLLRDKAPAGTETLGLLRPGEEKPVPFRVKAPAQGSETFSAVADPNENIEESDEGNNRSNLVPIEVRPAAVVEPTPPPPPPLPIPPPPPPEPPKFVDPDPGNEPPPPPARKEMADLRVYSVKMNPAQPVAGDEAVVDAVIENAGTAEARDVEVEFFLAGLSAGKERIGSIPAARTARVSRRVLIKQVGEVGLGVRVDPGNRIEEKDEGDNSKETALRIEPPPFPDLAIEDFAPESDRVETGRETLFRGRVVNRGTGRAEASRLEIRRGKERIREIRVPALDPGKGYDFSERIGMREEGDHEFEAGFAGLGFEDPTPENNAAAARCRWLPPPPPPPAREAFPDLAIAGYGIEPDRAREGERAVARVEVANAGEGPSPETEVELHLGNLAIKAPVPALRPRERVVVEIPFTAPKAGTYTVETHVDVKDRIRESDDRNNTSPKGRWKVEPGAPPPPPPPHHGEEAIVAVKSFRTDPEKPGEGSPFLLVFLLENSGHAAAVPAPFEVVLEGKIVAKGETPAIPAHKAVELALEMPALPKGTHEFDAGIGGGHLDEDHLHFGGTFTIAAALPPPPPPPAHEHAALKIRGYKVEPGRPVEGKPFRLTFDVENPGHEAAEPEPFEVEIEGKIAAKGETPAIPAHKSAALALEMEPLEKGTHEFEARIGGKGKGRPRVSGRIQVAAGKKPDEDGDKPILDRSWEAEAGEVKLSSPHKKGATVQAEAGASGGKVAALLAASEAELKFDVPKGGKFHVHLRARGTPFKGENPKFTFFFDGKPLTKMEAGADWTTLETPYADLSKGKHTLRIEYVNDEDKAGEGDRNLYLDWIKIVGK